MLTDRSIKKHFIVLAGGILRDTESAIRNKWIHLTKTVML